MIPRHPWRSPLRPGPVRVVLAALLVLASWPIAAHAQYFGQNRVRWERFDVQVLRTEHFDIHFDRAAESTVRETARKAERWYTRLSGLLGHTFTERKPLVLYTNHPDFQQTTLSGTPLSEGTRAFAESLRDRLVMPLTGVGAENDHVLGHEVAHLFQFDMARGTRGQNAVLDLPLWFVEGMAEYVSLGSDDPNTAMWLRSALLADSLPSVDELTTNPRLFPYRYGHAFWAYLGGRFGDDALAPLYRNALVLGVRGALQRTLGVPVEVIEDDWHTHISVAYFGLLAQREPASALGVPLTPRARDGGFSLNPQLSPDGAWLTYIGRDAFGRVDVRLRDMRTQRDVRSLGALARDGHTDAIAFLYASGGWSPDSRQYAQVVVRRGDSELAIMDVTTGTLRSRIRVPGVQSISALSWSPDGRQLAIAGTRNGQGDLFLYDIEEGRVQQLTNDGFTELHPAWAPNGRYIAIATDRHSETDLGSLAYGRLRLALIDPVGGRVRAVPDLGAGARMINPQWSADSRSLFFIGDSDGVADVFRLDLARGVFDQLTRVQTGISGITTRSPALTVSTATNAVVVTVFDRDGYQLVQLDRSRVESYQRLSADEVLATEPALQEPGGILPPSTSPAPLVDAMLADGATGLPGPTAGAPFVSRYRPRFALEGVGIPSAGVSAGTNGAAVGGGVSVFWGDLLARRRVGVALQAQGRVQDVGGQLFYLNAVSRWNVFASLGRTPFTTASSVAGRTRVRDAAGNMVDVTVIESGVSRTLLHQATVGAQYPFSRTRRFEFSAIGNRVTQDFDVVRQVVREGNGQVLDRRRLSGSAGEPLQYAEWSAAFVGDNTVFGATSPLVGWRYRVEMTQTTGRTTFTGVTLDGRWYQPAWRGSLALRGMHVGRYGRDAELGLLAPIFLGAGTLVRGYTAESIANRECLRVPAADRCDAFGRLLGSRMLVGSAEYRLPLTRLGGGALGIELAPFVDAGLAWSAGQSLAVQPQPLSAPVEAIRRPVVSAGTSLRISAGSVILEIFHARPLQRGGSVFGLNVAPGW